MLLPTYEAFKAHCLETPTREACGLIVGDTYFPCRNVAADLEGHFQIAPEEWDAIEDHGPVRAVCHSHPGAPSRPSELDLKNCKGTGIPWFILGEDGLWRIDPEAKPFTERVFEYGWSDCYSLVRDWFGNLPDFPREPKFWDFGHSPYEEHFAECGFETVPMDDARHGDILLMHVQAHVPNHAAVYLGEGRILHHLWGCLSREDSWLPWMKLTDRVLRRTA